ncbi:MAG: MgtC/SapB family protein [Erysipelotrichaceae bacterium]|nr:MgtC/SapB family protein [Erysipelotrichaceae bacterium]
MWLSEITFGSIFVRLILSILCGGVLGAERAMKRHAAGFRTYILVAVGAAIGGFTNQFIYEAFDTGDVARIANGVVTGIGFLGAGTILVTSRNKIKGLTTAAALWACGCMGLSIGHGFYTLGLAAGLIIFLILSVTPPIENFFIDHARSFTLHVELNARTDLKLLINYLREHGYSISNVEHNIAYASSGLSVYSISLILPENKGKKALSQTQVCNQIKELEYVNYAEILL